MWTCCLILLKYFESLLLGLCHSGLAEFLVLLECSYSQLRSDAQLIEVEQRFVHPKSYKTKGS